MPRALQSSHGSHCGEGSWYPQLCPERYSLFLAGAEGWVPVFRFMPAGSWFSHQWTAPWCQGLGRCGRGSPGLCSGVVAGPARTGCPQPRPGSDAPPCLFPCSHCTTSPPTPGSIMRTSKCEYLWAAVQMHSGVGGLGWDVGSQFPAGSQPGPGAGGGDGRGQSGQEFWA